ncbi:MAG TPA: hypothetical protein VME24_05675 [Alphaproteobacteria bacterium]|nr:hypothetical protein [Alphaproteobacteria bacterium]
MDCWINGLLEDLVPTTPVTIVQAGALRVVGLLGRTHLLINPQIH